MILTSILLLLVSGVNARDWSLSKDTVYEWRQDTVTLSNQGADTLRFSAVQLEVIRSDMPFMRLEVIFQISSLYAMWFNNVNGTYTSGPFTTIPKYYANAINAITTGINQSQKLSRFSIDSTIAPLAKRVVIAVSGDTLVTRLIFQAMNNRGQDTIILIGRPDINANATFLKTNQVDFLTLETRNKYFDLKGRLQKKSLRTYPSITLLPAK